VQEDKMVEITAEEQNKGIRMKRIEDSLRDFGVFLIVLALCFRSFVSLVFTGYLIPFSIL